MTTVTDADGGSSRLYDGDLRRLMSVSERSRSYGREVMTPNPITIRRELLASRR